MKPHRIVWDIVPSQGLWGWRLLMDGIFIRGFFTQKGAIEEARRLARFEWDTQRRPSEIQIHAKQSGQIRAKDSYPRESDPEDTRG